MVYKESINIGSSFELRLIRSFARIVRLPAAFDWAVEYGWWLAVPFCSGHPSSGFTWEFGSLPIISTK